MNHLIETVLNLLFPPRCAACRELLEENEKIMCRTCDAAYREAVARECPECLKPMRSCTCPNRFLDRHGIHKVAKLFRYRPRESELPTNRLIYRLKRAESVSVISFLAEELSESIKPLLDEKYSYVLVGVPRSKEAIRTYGYDHVKLLCRAMSRVLGIPYISAVRRIGHTGQQKKKNYRERLISAIQSYEPARGIDLRGKRVILVDDVVTSGATIAACARAVRRIGARTVFAAVLGSSYRYSDLIGAKRYYHEKEKYSRFS